MELTYRKRHTDAVNQNEDTFRALRPVWNGRRELTLADMNDALYQLSIYCNTLETTLDALAIGIDTQSREIARLEARVTELEERS